jgi:NAD(P)-dependent dehydrogenase (short-subunit alcohol dehydrogenase family)
VTSDDSVRSAVARVEGDDGKLDILINNAGIPGLQPILPSEQPLDDIKTIYETNVFAPIRVTQAFLPLLKAATDASVIMVSSGLGSLGWLSDPSNPHYGVNILGYNSSKTALNAVTVAFAKELAACGITVNTADPGYTATDFNGHTGHRTVEQAATGIVWLATRNAQDMTGRFYFEQNEVPW